jgi:predicted aldo/keto reductase-like oxidoreductase
METRRLGRTGMYVSAVSFGALPIQRCTLEEAGPVFRAALDAGVNFIDTARAYTDSEIKIGLHIAEKRHRYYLASKSLARDGAKIQADVELSLSNMRTSRIDLYQIHNIKDREELGQVLAPGGAYDGLLAKKGEGKIGFIGITGHKPSLLADALKSGLFDTVQVPYNVVEQEAAQNLFPLARELNVGIIAMKPLGGGQLKQTEASLRFVLQQKDVVAIPGMDRTEHVAENTAAANPVRPLAAKELADLEEEAQAAGKTFCRRCGYCLPCAAGIDIPQLFIFHLQYKRYGMTRARPIRYAQLPVKASACIDCGACESRCPYELPIRDWLKEIAREIENKPAQG